MGFFYISDDETNCTIGIVSQNLATQLNFVEFRYSRNITYFEVTGVGQHMASHVDDTWRTMWVTHGKPCVTMHGKGMPCVNMHGTFEAYIYGVSNSVCGGAASFSPWEQQGEGGGREKRKGGKEKSKGEKEEKKRKGKKKREEKKKKRKRGK